MFLKLCGFSLIQTKIPQSFKSKTLRYTYSAAGADAAHFCRVCDQGIEFSPQMTMSSYKFNGMERDAETGLDHTLFRQYSSTSPVTAQTYIATPPSQDEINAYVNFVAKTTGSATNYPYSISVYSDEANLDYSRTRRGNRKGRVSTLP